MTHRFISPEKDDCTTRYFKEISKKQTLPHEEQLKLFKLIKKNDQNALNKLVEGNLKFVVLIAKQYQNNGLPLIDLINEGNYGLIQAATRFKPTRKYKFPTYAVWWIRQSILNALYDNSRLVKVSTKVLQRIKREKRELEKLEAEDNDILIYEKLDQMSEFFNYGTQQIISTSTNYEEDGMDISNMLVGDEIEIEEPDIAVSNEINVLLNELDEREKDIVKCYFGININTEPMTLEAIGEKHSLTKERVRQIKERSLRKIRDKSHKLYDLLHETL